MISFFFLMIRRPPRSTLDRSSAASDVYKRQLQDRLFAEIEFHHLGHVGIDRLVVGDAGADGVGPVSYTHLRAHETVLDLVCRLLLDKKKTSTTTTCSYLNVDDTDVQRTQTSQGTTIRRVHLYVY